MEWIGVEYDLRGYQRRAASGPQGGNVTDIPSLIERLEASANDHDAAGGKWNMALFADAAAALRELQEDAAYCRSLSEAARGEVGRLRDVIDNDTSDYEAANERLTAERDALKAVGWYLYEIAYKDGSYDIDEMARARELLEGTDD